MNKLTPEMKSRIKTTPQGYMYVEVTKEDCLNWGGFAMCDLCGEMFEKSYLVFVLNGAICEKCFNEWVQRAKRYEDDLRLQEECYEDWFKFYLEKVQ